MVKAYLSKLGEAKRENFSPPPTMRDLNNVADNWLKGKEIEQPEPEVIEKSVKVKRVARPIIENIKLPLPVIENIIPVAVDEDEVEPEDTWTCGEIIAASLSLGMYAYLKNCIGLKEDLTTPASIAKIALAVLLPPVAQLIGIFSIFCQPKASQQHLEFGRAERPRL